MGDTLALHDAPSDIKPRMVADPYKPRFKAGNRKAITHLLIIQQQLLRDIQNQETPSQAKASCARAWTDCEERIRILRGKPLPGAYKPLAKDATKKRTVVMAES